MGSKLKLFKSTDIRDTEESRVNISEYVEKLRILIREKYKSLRLPPNSDIILARSLRHRKYNMIHAVEQIHTYFKVFADLSKLNEKNIFLPSTHRQYYFDSFALGILKQRDLQETPILVTDFDKMPGETFRADEVIAVAILVFNELIKKSTQTQNLGIVVVVNLKGFNFAHVKQLSLSRLRIVANLIQGAIPVSIKAIHFINVPSIFSITYSLISVFLKQKIKDRIHFYTTDLTEFHKVVAQNFAPTVIGGYLSSEESIDTEFTKELCEKDDYYKEFLKYGYTPVTEMHQDT